MQSATLGSTGLTVSRICLGTATFGLQCDEATSHAILDRAVDLGVTFIDTADKYPLGGSVQTAGRTEEIVGRWLLTRRDEVVIATKFHGRMGTAAWDEGTSRKHILDAIDGSLRRLGVDYIDLYQFHRPDPRTPIEESLSALDDLVRAGKIRYVGCSNFMAYQVALALGTSDLRRLVRLVSVQPCYNLIFRQCERELFALAREQNLAVLPYNPLAGGLLSGKHQQAIGPTAGTRFTLGSASELYQARYWNQGAFDAVAAVGEVAAELSLPMPTLAIGWVLANPVVSSAIIGASRPEQLDATIAGTEITIPPDAMSTLAALTHEFRYGDSLE